MCPACDLRGFVCRQITRKIWGLCFRSNWMEVSLATQTDPKQIPKRFCFCVHSQLNSIRNKLCLKRDPKVCLGSGWDWGSAQNPYGIHMFGIRLGNSWNPLGTRLGSILKLISGSQLKFPKGSQNERLNSLRKIGGIQNLTIFSAKSGTRVQKM